MELAKHQHKQIAIRKGFGDQDDCIFCLYVIYYSILLHVFVNLIIWNNLSLSLSIPLTVAFKILYLVYLCQVTGYYVHFH